MLAHQQLAWAWHDGSMRVRGACTHGSHWSAMERAGKHRTTCNSPTCFQGIDLGLTQPQPTVRGIGCGGHLEDAADLGGRGLGAAVAPAAAAATAASLACSSLLLWAGPPPRLPKLRRGLTMLPRCTALHARHGAPCSCRCYTKRSTGRNH